jgi:hypothetical protein
MHDGLQLCHLAGCEEARSAAKDAWRSSSSLFLSAACFRPAVACASLLDSTCLHEVNYVAYPVATSALAALNVCPLQCKRISAVKSQLSIDTRNACPLRYTLPHFARVAVTFRVYGRVLVKVTQMSAIQRLFERLVHHVFAMKPS